MAQCILANWNSLTSLLLLRKNMTRRSVLILIATCLLSTREVAIADSTKELIWAQTKTLDGVSVHASVEYISSFGYLVRAIVTAPKVANLDIGCIFLSTDFRYELRNSAGKIMPIDRHGLETAPTVMNIAGYSTSARAVAQPACKPVLHTGSPAALTIYRRLRLLPLYPGVSDGVYSLQITFAPRGFGQTMQFTPVKIIVDKNAPNGAELGAGK